MPIYSIGAFTMKKLITLFTLFLASCTSVKKDEFVNPIFYKTMYPISTIASETQITPTSYRGEYNGYVTTGNCILLENKQDSIKLKCEMLYSGETNTRTEIIKYELSTDKNPYTYNENEQEVIEYDLENETSENFSSKVWLYINLLE